MDGLIGLLVWVAIISKVVKAFKGEDKKKSSQTASKNRQMSQQRPVQKTTQAQRDAYYYNQQKTTKERLQQKYAPQQNVTQQKATRQQDILARAKENVREEEPNVMQQQMHAEVCRDYRATADAATSVTQHKAVSHACDTGEESDIIKRVNDLMITGYSGEMNFDRDFIAEGVEMLNRFSI